MSGFGLAHVLKGTGPILLDFDGPVCSIFADYPADVVASELRGMLLGSGVQIPPNMMTEADPLQILRWTGALAVPALTHAVEDALRAAEVRASETAIPTPGARELLTAARERSRPVAIVSNNSAPAINAYVNTRRLNKYISAVVGREPYRPQQMKPNPEPVINAIIALDVTPQACVLIGDSLSDITAGHAAGVPVIGYANKPSKMELFTEAGADAVVTAMAEVVAVLKG